MQQDNRNGVAGRAALPVLFKFISTLNSLVDSFVAAISQDTPYPGIYPRALASAAPTNTIMLHIRHTRGRNLLTPPTQQ